MPVALFLGAHLGFRVQPKLRRGDCSRFAAAYAFSLVSIAVSYEVTHYYTLLLVQEQLIVGYASDPLGRS